MLIRIKLDPDKRDKSGWLPLAPEIRLALGEVQASAGLDGSLMQCSRCAAFRAEKPLGHNETFSLDELSIKTEHERGFFSGNQ